MVYNQNTDRVIKLPHFFFFFYCMLIICISSNFLKITYLKAYSTSFLTFNSYIMWCYFLPRLLLLGSTLILLGYLRIFLSWPCLISSFFPHSFRKLFLVLREIKGYVGMGTSENLTSECCPYTSFGI